MKLRYEKCMSSAVFKDPTRMISDYYLKVDSQIKRLEKVIENKKQVEKEKYVKLVSKLDALSPLKTLTRGYSIIESDDKIVKSVNDLSKGQKVEIRLVDGKKEAQVL